jgi:hypothetical protein
MFANRFLAELSTEQQIQVLQLVERQLKPTLYRDGKWWADYRRIRVVAQKCNFICVLGLSLVVFHIYDTSNLQPYQY